jgi:hypothetical protein
VVNGGTTVDSLVSPAGDRLGVKSGGSLNWFLPVPHGNTVMGGAQDPLSMNRFLYALANPATLIDPSWHFATRCDSGALERSRCLRSTRRDRR